jgi:hypothetical protein
MIKPRPRPCPACPYRRDVPSGLWDAEEYDKLAKYDGPTWAQATTARLCHSSPDHLCAGWVGCHDMNENLAIRVHHEEVDVQACHDYRTDVALFDSGAEAAAHGKKFIGHPGEATYKMIGKLIRMIDKRERAANV